MAFVLAAAPLSGRVQGGTVLRGALRGRRACARSTVRAASRVSSGNGTVKKDGEDVWYFAYGSNLSPRVFGDTASVPLRQVKYKDARRARVPGYKLVFDAPGLPPFEPAMANIRRNNSSAVRGVAYRLTPEAFEKVHASEAYTKFIEVPAEDENGQEITVRAFQFRSSARAESIGPSERYLNTVLSGVKYWGLGEDYYRSVARIKPSSSLTNILFRLQNVATGRFQGLFSPRDMLPRKLEKVVQAEHWRDGDVRIIDLSGPRDLGTPNENSNKDLLIYIPGIDGTGLGIVSLAEDLSRKFTPCSVVVPITNRSDWGTLATEIESAIEKEIEKRGCAQAVIFSESMGSVIGLWLTSRRPDLVKHLVIVNPATSFADSLVAPLYENLGLDVIPEPIYRAIPYLSLPLLVDPARMALSLTQSMDRALFMFGSMLSIGMLADILKPDVIRHRLSLLRNSPINDDLLRNISVPTTVFAAWNDIMLPSLKESARLVKLIPNCERTILNGGAHTPLLTFGIEELDLCNRIEAAMKRQRSREVVRGVAKKSPPFSVPPASSTVGVDASK